MVAIEIKDLVKIFKGKKGAKVDALKGVSLSVESVMGVNATIKPSTRTWHVAGLAFGRVGGLRDTPLPTGAARRDMANRGLALPDVSAT